MEVKRKMLVYNETDYITESNIEMKILNSDLNKDTELILMEALTNPVKAANNSFKRRFIQYFKNFIASLQGIIKRFIDNLTRLFKSNDTWLSDNASNILNCDLKNFEYEMFPYWNALEYQKRISNSLPKINDLHAKKIIELGNTKASYRDYLVNEVLGMRSEKIRLANDGDFQDDLKMVLRGRLAKTILGKEMDRRLRSFFDYCRSYTTNQKTVQAIFNDIKVACNQATSKLNQQAAVLDNDPSNSPENQKEVKDNNTVVKESFDFLNIFLEEAETGKPKEEPSKGAAEIAKEKGSPTTPSELNKANEEKQEKQEKKEEPNPYERKSKDEIKDLITAYQIYINVHQEILSVKMSNMEEQYKVYMKLMRIIARKAMGQSTSKKETGKNSTNAERNKKNIDSSENHIEYEKEKEEEKKK